MIISLSGIGLAFVWLLYETNWMMVRLLAGLDYKIGDCCQWRLPDCSVTEEMKDELIRLWKGKQALKGLSIGSRYGSGNTSTDMAPLCGWGYAYQYHAFMPPTTVELLAPGYHATMNIKSPSIFKDVMRVYRNPHLKVRL